MEVYALKIRIKFEKLGNMRFIGHLDIMRYFQKAMRRADIPIKYSEGFSPHQIMSFAAPLGMGLEGFGEYMDIELEDEKIGGLSSLKAIEKLNDNMCEGMRVLSFLRLPENVKNAMSIVSYANYSCILESSLDISIFEAAIKELLDMKEIFIEKKSKNDKLKSVDIRPLINELSVKKDGENIKLYMYIAQGSANNLKPEFVLEVLSKTESLQGGFKVYRIQRLNMYDSEHIGLEEYGEEIK